MSVPTDKSFVQRQIVEMDRLLELAGDHPLMGFALRQRREDFQKQLSELPPAGPEPRTVLFFTGKPVLGSAGIDAQFASDVLRPFLEMVKTQYAAAKHGQVGSRGRRRDESEAKLLLTGLPRGSFGLELVQPNPQNLFGSQQLSDVLVRLTELIKSAGESDGGFTHALEEISPRVLDRLKDFFKVIAENKASLRMESGDLECSLDQQRVSLAFERVSKAETKENVVEKGGIFRGATLDSWRFDFRTDEGENITGRLGEEVSEAAAEAMLGLTNKPCLAGLHESTVKTSSGVTRARYELLALSEKT